MGKEHRLLLDPQDPSAGGTITRESDTIANTLPNGVVQRWSCREYNFDVFANTASVSAPQDTTKVDEAVDEKKDKKEKNKRGRSSSSHSSSHSKKKKKNRRS